MSAVEAERPTPTPPAAAPGEVAAVAPEAPASSSASSAYLLVPIFSLAVLLVVAVARSPNLISSAGIGSAIIVAAPLILATYALTPIAMAGRGGVDLSVGPLLGFINVTLITLSGLEVLTTPFEIFAYAIGAGVAYQIIMGLIIVFVRVQPIIVSLAGYLALAGHQPRHHAAAGRRRARLDARLGRRHLDLFAGAGDPRARHPRLAGPDADRLLRPSPADGRRRARRLFERGPDRCRPHRRPHHRRRLCRTRGADFHLADQLRRPDARQHLHADGRDRPRPRRHQPRRRPWRGRRLAARRGQLSTSSPMCSRPSTSAWCRAS